LGVKAVIFEAKSLKFVCSILGLCLKTKNLLVRNANAVQATLEKTWGTALGKVLYLQSRERPVGPPKVTSARSKITLARSAGVDFVAADVSSDDELDDEESADATAIPGAYVVNLA